MRLNGILGTTDEGWLRKCTAALCVLVCMAAGTKAGAQNSLEEMFADDWSFESISLAEKTGQYSAPKVSVYTDLAALKQKAALPFLHTITSIVVLDDKLNLNTIGFNLLDATYRLKVVDGRQVLEVDDNRPVDQREQAVLTYGISILGDRLKLGGTYFYTNEEGRAVEGVLTTTLVRMED